MIYLLIAIAAIIIGVKSYKSLGDGFLSVFTGTLVAVIGTAIILFASCFIPTKTIETKQEVSSFILGEVNDFTIILKNKTVRREQYVTVVESNPKIFFEKKYYFTSPIATFLFIGPINETEKTLY